MARTTSRPLATSTHVRPCASLSVSSMPSCSSSVRTTSTRPMLAARCSAVVPEPGGCTAFGLIALFASSRLIVSTAQALCQHPDGRSRGGGGGGGGERGRTARAAHGEVQRGGGQPRVAAVARAPIACDLGQEGVDQRRVACALAGSAVPSVGAGDGGGDVPERRAERSLTWYSGSLVPVVVTGILVVRRRAGGEEGRTTVGPYPRAAMHRGHIL